MDGVSEMVTALSFPGKNTRIVSVSGLPVIAADLCYIRGVDNNGNINHRETPRCNPTGSKKHMNLSKSYSRTIIATLQKFLNASSHPAKNVKAGRTLKRLSIYLQCETASESKDMLMNPKAQSCFNVSQPHFLS